MIQHGITVYNTIWHNMVQQRTTHHDTTWYNSEQNNMIQHGTTVNNTPWYNVVQQWITVHDKTWYSSVQYNTLQHDTILYKTILNIKTLYNMIQYWKKKKQYWTTQNYKTQNCTTRHPSLLYNIAQRYTIQYCTKLYNTT